MFKNVEKQILDFVDTLPEVKRREVVHGTLYVILEDEKDCDIIHYAIRDFYRKKINPEGGVNMYAVGDEFAFDFVPADREAPVFTDEEENGVWSEFAEEGLEEMQREEAEAEIAMEFEAESKRGK